MSNLRVAVVGLNLGLAHARAYSLAEHAELKWVVDLNDELAKKTAEELGCQYTTDWTSILDEVDAVSLCTPHHLHASQALTAIEAGKHVLLEKPLANTEQECQQIIRRAEKKGTVLMLAYVVRYLPALRKLKEVVDSGVYGQPINISCWVEGMLPPVPGTWFASKEKLGGGVLFSHGCHYIDILIWLMGNPTHVAAMGTRNGTEWMEGEGTSHSIMTFENGALGHLVVSWGMKHKEPPAKLHIHTTDALIILGNRMSTVEVVTDEGRKVLHEPDETETNTPRVLYEVEHFIDCIRTGKTPETDGHEGMRSHQAIWSMYDHPVAPIPYKNEVKSHD